MTEEQYEFSAQQDAKAKGYIRINVLILNSQVPTVSEANKFKNSIKIIYFLNPFFYRYLWVFKKSGISQYAGGLNVMF
jgi:hypothetical protein